MYDFLVDTLKTERGTEKEKEKRQRERLSHSIIKTRDNDNDNFSSIVHVPFYSVDK